MIETQNPEKILVSACLLGVKCRYDGSDSLNTELISDVLYRLIPVCPEQMGGLSTPREPCEITAGSGEDVLDGKERVVGIKTGTDFTRNFLSGAQQTLQLVRLFGCRKAFFKSLSPSCGMGRIRRGEELVTGNGVTTALLRRNEIEVIVY